MLFKISIALGVIIAMGFSMYRFIRGCTWIGELFSGESPEPCGSACEPQGEKGAPGLGWLTR
jgi:hypothetical protein